MQGRKRGFERLSYRNRNVNRLSSFLYPW